MNVNTRVGDFVSYIHECSRVPSWNKTTVWLPKKTRRQAFSLSNTQPSILWHKVAALVESGTFMNHKSICRNSFIGANVRGAPRLQEKVSHKDAIPVGVGIFWFAPARTRIIFAKGRSSNIAHNPIRRRLITFAFTAHFLAMSFSPWISSICVQG